MPTNQWLNGYFSKLNPVAEKIALDMSEVISAYDHVWLTLTTTQQDSILNDTIIKPEITIRYYNNALQTGKEIAAKASVESSRKKGTKKEQKPNMIYAFDRINLRSFIHQSVGLKILHDDNIGDYRDEHSFPFSYKTKSQINLALLGSKGDDDAITAIQLSPKILPPIIPRKDSTESNRQKQIMPFRDVEPKRVDIIKCAESIDSAAADEKVNLLANFGSKNTLLSISTDSNDFDNDSKEQHSEKSKLLPESLEMPKGFDFLSNW